MVRLEKSVEPMDFATPAISASKLLQSVHVRPNDCAGTLPLNRGIQTFYVVLQRVHLSVIVGLDILREFLERLCESFQIVLEIHEVLSSTHRPDL